jgi:hypothetical protein
MVSEDSQDLGWLSMVHRLCDLRDLDDPRHREMPSEFHQLDDLSELLEVVSLRRSQGMLPEEWNDDGAEVIEPPDAIPEHIFPVIVVPAVAIHLATSEEPNHVLQDAAARGSLGDGKLWSNLPPQGHLAASVDGNAETALSVDESHDPSDGRESFLLVFRTSRIVTAAHARNVPVGCDAASS